jgi:hypothetical protein
VVRPYVEFFECSFSGAVFIRAYTLAGKLRKRRIVADDLLKMRYSDVKYRVRAQLGESFGEAW